MPMKRIAKTKCELVDQTRESAEKIRKQTDFVPEIALILGTGLGNLAKRVEAEASIPYGEIPHFPESTVESHAGQLVLGKLSGRRVAVMEGRFHHYEGYAAKALTFPVRVLHELGAKILIVSNAAGGLNPVYAKGEIILLEDHINFMGINPLIGPHDERLGDRFPDMCAPYSERLIKLAEETAARENLQVRRGVYMAVTGPNLETRAEYRMMRMMGADLVGMSTVPEVIVGVQCRMEVLGISIVTDACDPDHLEPVNIQEIIRTANEAGVKLDRLLAAAVKKF
ncbi:MAG: purine-nucleoside phosphorylase [Candidatus Omnitrophota bacterium]|jgi:purine-nucleoside phosphorylase